MFLGCLPGRPSKQLPLISVLLQCEVNGGIASVKATQSFRNEDPDPLECVYKFPVQDEAAIVSLTVTTEDGRVFEAKVEDQEEAKEKYSDNISSGNTAIMGRVKEDKEFELNIGNLAPNTGISTTINFVLPLKCTTNRWLLKVPGWLQPTLENAIPAFPLPGSQPVPNQKYQFEFSLTIQELSPIIEVTSPSHQVAVVYDDLRLKALVTLNARNPASQNSNEILIEFKTNEDFSPKVQVEHDESTGEYVGMLSFLPPLLEEGQSVDDLEGYGDYVLVLDRSGSMSGRSIEMAKEAAILFIRSLPTTSKFNIVSFGSGFEKMFPESQLIESSTVTQAISNISNFKADLGGTNILAPLRAICTERSDPTYPRSIYLLTDGAVEDSQSTINFVEQNSKQTRVHAFGIGGSVDRSLIIECAKATNGAFAFIAEAIEIKEKVISVLKTGMVPALSNLQIHWPSDTYVQYPSNQLLPVCYFGEAFHAFVHLGKAAVQAGSALVTCTNTANKRNLSWEVPIDTKCGTGNFIEKLWAKYAIKELSLNYRQTQNRDTLQKVKSLSKQYGVPCEHTAFLCVQTNAQPVEGKLQITSISMGALKAHPQPQGPPAFFMMRSAAPQMSPGMSYGSAGGFPQPVMQFGSAPRQGLPQNQPMSMKPGAAFGGPQMPGWAMQGPLGGMPQMRNPVGNPGFPGAQQGLPARMPQMGPGVQNFQPMPGEMPMGFQGPMAGSPGGKPGFGNPGVSGGVPMRFPGPMGGSGGMGMPMGSPGGMGMPMRSPNGMGMPMGSPGGMPQNPIPIQLGCPAQGNMMAPPARSAAQGNSQRTPPSQELDLATASLLDLISKQEVDGKWFFASVPTVSTTFLWLLGEIDDPDLCATLCVVVLIKKKFAAQEKEWELIVKKAVKLLRKAGVNIDQYSARIEAQLGF